MNKMPLKDRRRAQDSYQYNLMQAVELIESLVVVVNGIEVPAYVKTAGGYVNNPVAVAARKSCRTGARS